MNLIRLKRVLSVLVGLVFLFSAISKLPTLEPFGWTIVETTRFNWIQAEWLARLLISLEAFLGILFISQWKVSRLARPLSLGLLLIFSIYLVLVIREQGSQANCGCFGEWLPMTHAQSLWKNGILIFLTGLLYGIPEIKSRIYPWLVSIGLLMSIALPIFWLLPESLYIRTAEARLQRPIPLSTLYQSSGSDSPSINLRKGKHIIAFMSLTCHFCRKAARRLAIMKKDYPELPFFMVLNGDSTHLSSFWTETRSHEIEHVLFNGAGRFMRLSGSHSLPSIQWVEDTTVVRESNYMSLDEQEILLWLKDKQ